MCPKLPPMAVQYTGHMIQMETLANNTNRTLSTPKMLRFQPTPLSFFLYSPFKGYCSIVNLPCSSYTYNGVG